MTTRIGPPAFCMTCGEIIKPGSVKRSAIHCSERCRYRAGNRRRIGYKKPWRYCGACGHTEEMHLDVEGNRNCMEPAGPDGSPNPFCGCLWVNT